MTQGKDWRKKSEIHFTEDEIEKINEIKASQVDANLRRKLDDKMFTDACIHLQRLFKIMANRYSKDINEKIGKIGRSTFASDQTRGVKVRFF